MSCYDVTIRDCIIETSGAGVPLDIEDVVKCTIENNEIHSYGDTNPLIEIGSLYDSYIGNNRLFGGSNGIECVGHHFEGVTIHANRINAVGYSGIKLEASASYAPAWTHIIGNIIDETGNSASGASNHAAISLIGWSTSRYSDSASPPNQIGCIIADNTIENAQHMYGIYLQYTPGVKVHHNSIEEAEYDGIHVADTTGATIDHNQVAWCGFGDGGDTYDGIHIDGVCDEVEILHNRIKNTPSVGDHLLNGINVAAATCTRTIVVGNDLIDFGGTTPISDSGTDTRLVYPDDVAYGDNFVDTGS